MSSVPSSFYILSTYSPVGSLSSEERFDGDITIKTVFYSDFFGKLMLKVTKLNRNEWFLLEHVNVSLKFLLAHQIYSIKTFDLFELQINYSHHFLGFSFMKLLLYLENIILAVEFMYLYFILLYTTQMVILLHTLNKHLHIYICMYI